MVAIAILDDYQGAALEMADWSRLRETHEINVFREPFNDLEHVIRALERFEVIAIMRERTPFPRALIDGYRNFACWSPQGTAMPPSI